MTETETLTPRQRAERVAELHRRESAGWDRVAAALQLLEPDDYGRMAAALDVHLPAALEAGAEPTALELDAGDVSDAGQNGAGEEPPARPEPPLEPPAAPAPSPPPPPDLSAAKPRPGGRAYAAETDRLVFELVGRHYASGIKPREIQAELDGRGQEAIRGATKRLLEAGKIRAEGQRAARRYFPTEGPVAEPQPEPEPEPERKLGPGPDEARTASGAIDVSKVDEPDRSVLEAIIHAGRPKTTAALAIDTGIRSDVVGACCHRLERRGLVRVLRPATSDNPPRWALR